MTDLASLCLALVAACSPSEGLWRDQLVFIGDRGTVVPLTLVRQTPGSGEAKGWLGQDGRWRSVFYDRFAVRGQDASAFEASVAAWSRAPDRSAYVSLSRASGRVDLRVRTRSSPSSLTISASRIRQLGTSIDPEGSSRWSASRARIRGLPQLGKARPAEDVLSGWLLVEETPADQPKHPFVEYGDFVLAFLASEDGDLLIFKRSRRRNDFDLAIARIDGKAARTEEVIADVAQDRLSVSLPELSYGTSLEIRDRDETSGVAPNGRSITYQTLLLSGALNGAAMVIR